MKYVINSGERTVTFLKEVSYNRLMRRFDVSISYGIVWLFSRRKHSDNWRYFEMKKFIYHVSDNTPGLSNMVKASLEDKKNFLRECWTDLMCTYETQDSGFITCDIEEYSLPSKTFETESILCEMIGCDKETLKSISVSPYTDARCKAE